MGLFNKKTTFTEILEGVDTGKMQTVGLMQVIPLLSDLSDDRFIAPTQAKVSTSGYGRLVFDNVTDSIVIVPCNATYILSQAAQDHAMAQAGVIPGKKAGLFDNAMCIQQSQGGLIKAGNHKMMILPFSLREKALELRDVREYNKLWKYIERFNKQFGINAGGELKHFFTQFEKELDQFVAEFECVPRQVGAVILINGEIAGIERAPSVKYWKSVWTALIRECYGSLAIEAGRKTSGAAKEPKTRIPLGKADTLEELRAALAEAEKQEKETAACKIREIFNESLTLESDEDTNGMKIQTYENKEFTGQVIKDGNKIIYGSFIAREYRMNNRGWRKDSAFSVNDLINKIFN